MLKHITVKKKLSIFIVALLVVSYATGSYFSYDQGYAHGYIQGLAEAGGTPTISPDGIYDMPWVNGTAANFEEFYLNSEDKTDLFTYPEQDSSYVIFKSGITYYAKNGTTGQIDYSGADALTVIQAAHGLPAGRTWKETVVLKGDFNFGLNIITLPSYTTFVSDGEMILGQLYASPGSTDIDVVGGYYIGTKASVDIIFFNGTAINYVKNCTVKNAHIKYDASVLVDGEDGIKIYYGDNIFVINNIVEGIGEQGISFSFVKNGIIDGNSVKRATQKVDATAEAAISLLDLCERVTVSNNIVIDNDDIGISVAGGKQIVITNNLVKNNGKGQPALTQSGIYIDWYGGIGTKDIIITNNIVDDNGKNGIHIRPVDTTDIIVAENIVSNNTLMGIHVESAKYVSISGNSVNENGDTGIYSSGDYTSVKGNTIYSNGLNGIQFTNAATNIVIADNTIFDNSVSNPNTKDGIVTASSYGTITGNSVFDSQPVLANKAQRYGIHLSTSTYITVIGNNLAGNRAGGTYSGGIGNIIRNNIGHVTENSGIATLWNLTSSITVPHGLSYTPTAGDISVTPITNLSNCTQYWFDTIGAANFVIHVGDAGVEKNTVANIQFAWRADRH